MPVVDIRGVVCVVNTFPVLVDANFTVGPGQVVSIGGANGSGKTTLLRLVAGLVRPRSGSCLVFGHDPVEKRQLLRPRFSYLGHSPALYEDLTLAENVTFMAEAAARHAPAGEVSPGGPKALAGKSLERVGIDKSLCSVPARHASAGQRRRASLAALLVKPSGLWLLDEPLNGLDSDGRALLRGLMKDAKTAGGTVLFTSHENDLADVADRSVRVDGGTVLEESLERQVIDVS